MDKARSHPRAPLDSRLVTALVLAAFLSPGAWLVVTLPSQPVAQALHLVTAGIWIGVVGWVAAQGARLPQRPLLYALAAVVAVAVLSLALNVFPVQQALFDLYGEMPGVMWLAYPAVFLAAACLPLGAHTRDAMRWTVYAGAVLIAVMVVWRWTQGFVTTFGSPAYSVPALAPLVFVAFGLARTSKERSLAYDLLALGMALGLAYAAAGLSAIFMLGMGLLLVAAVAPRLLPVPSSWYRGVRIAGRVAFATACVIMLLVQVPALGSWIIDAEKGAGAEQTVATRLYLWEGAQRMVAERPVLGYGPAGYRFFAVGYYDPGVFSYIAGAGSDPTAYSAPSPHSLLWEALTRLGALGLAALVALLAVWARRVRELVAEAPGSPAGVLRVSLAVGFAAYLFALMVTPVHFASGLLGVVVAGFAVAAPARSAVDARERPGSGAARASASETAAVSGSATVSAAGRWVALTLAVALAGYGVWRGVGLSAGEIAGQGDIAADTARVERAARIIGGEPLNERRRLDLALVGATTSAELDAACAAVDAAPGYVTDFAPNLVQFAAFGIGQGEALGETGFAWERTLLERAEKDVPALPSLAAEQLHLAIVTGDVAALPDLIERAEALGATYPATADYVVRAREMLVP